jgi:hypothetical protein
MDQGAQLEHCQMNAAAALFVLALYSNDVQTGRSISWDTKVAVDTAACTQHVGARAAVSDHEQITGDVSVGSSSAFSSVRLCLRIIRGLPLMPGIPSLLPAGSSEMSPFFLFTSKKQCEFES